MKRNLLTVVCAVFFSLGATAQYYHLPAIAGNPENVNQEDVEEPFGALTGWTSLINSGGSMGTYSSSVTIPFTFLFDGDTVTSYRASNTGIVTFSQLASPAVNSAGTASSLNNSVFPDSSVIISGINSTGSNDRVANKTFGTAPYRQHWIFFTSNSITGTSGTNWTYWSVVLEETTNNIYIVDQRTYGGPPSLTMGVRVDSANTFEKSSVSSLSSNSPSKGDNNYYMFGQGAQPDYDMNAYSVDVAPFIALNAAPFTIKADFVNQGAQTLTGATFNYSINGGTAVSTSLTGLSIATGGMLTATSSTTWTPSAAGTYVISTWLDGLNGTNSDTKNYNDTIYHTVEVVSALASRVTLVETFTSSTCAPCVLGNTTIEGILANNPGEYTSLKYQMNWPGNGDPYYFSEGGDRRQFYGVNSVPRAEIDGGWDANGSNMTQAIFDDYQSAPAFLEMDATYSVWNQVVEATVEIEALANINSSNLKLFAVIYSHLDTANVGSNGETEFHHVVKKMMPSSSGESIAALVSGNTYTHTFSYTFNGSYILPPNANSPVNLSTNHTVEDFTNLGVVFFVQDASTKEVFQSVDATYTIGVDEASLATSLKVYPNPATDVIVVEGEWEKEVMVSLTDLSGRTIATKAGDFANGNTVTFDVSDIPAGTYLMVVRSGGDAHARPVVIQ